MEYFNPMASYAIVNKIADRLNIEHIKVPYNVKLAVTECEKEAGQIGYIF